MFAIVSDSVHNRSTASSESDGVCIYVDDESHSCPFTSRTDHTYVGQCPFLPSVTFPRRCWTQSLFVVVFNNVRIRFSYRVSHGVHVPFSVSTIRDDTRLTRCSCLRRFGQCSEPFPYGQCMSVFVVDNIRVRVHVHDVCLCSCVFPCSC